MNLASSSTERYDIIILLFYLHRPKHCDTRAISSGTPFRRYRSGACLSASTKQECQDKKKNEQAMKQPMRLPPDGLKVVPVA